MKKDFDTVRYEPSDNSIEIIDQTLLPGTCRFIRLRTPNEVFDAIRRLSVRGAPAIGVCAAMAVYMESAVCSINKYDAFRSHLFKVCDYLADSRPTAVNLFWALGRMRGVISSDSSGDTEILRKQLFSEMTKIRDKDVESCRRIGKYGMMLIKDGWGILTHCNAGRLCAVKYGTATAPMYLAHDAGLKIRVYADETRPLLQGARLTAWELSEAGIDTTLLCDNMSGALMRSGKINAVFVGCDRVAANGDTANKIGTSMVALAAKHYNIPFYVCAPISTIDLACPNGNHIPIEERGADEITQMWYSAPMAPESVSVFNPAFDITDAELIHAFITEKGIIYPPFGRNLAGFFKAPEGGAPC